MELSTCSLRPVRWWANALAAAVKLQNCKKASSVRMILADSQSGKQQMVGCQEKQPTKAVVSALLNDGCVRVTGLYSEKTGKTYDATVVLEDDGQYANFKLEFDQRKGGSR